MAAERQVEPERFPVKGKTEGFQALTQAGHHHVGLWRVRAQHIGIPVEALPAEEPDGNGKEGELGDEFLGLRALPGGALAEKGGGHVQMFLGGKGALAAPAFEPKLPLEGLLCRLAVQREGDEKSHNRLLMAPPR